MALRGNLKDFSLPDVFQLVQLSRKTGVLRIVGQDAEGTIWFRDGEVFFAQSDWRRDHLGERLVAAQRITPAALARALEIRSAEPDDGRRLGQILVDEGYITHQVLEAFVQEQIQDTIFDLMRWEEGDFDFEVLPDVVDEDIGLSVSVENIVMEGSRRLEEWGRIKKKVPSTDMVFKMATAPGEGTFEISLKPAEWNLLLLVDGTRSVSELAHTTRRTDFEVARIIYGLFSAGLLEVPSDDEVERLRADRVRREQRRAAAGTPAPAEVPAQAEAPAQAESIEVAPVTPAVDETRPESGTSGPAEEPAFLSAAGHQPSADDMAVFEQMMGAVLGPQAAEEAPVIAPEAPTPQPEAYPSELEGGPYVPAAPPVADEASLVSETLPPDGEVVQPTADEFAVGALTEAEIADIPAPPVAEQLGSGFVPTGDFEADLRTLGLGELPPELRAPAAEAEMPSEADAEDDLVPEPAQEPEEWITGEPPSVTREPMSSVDETVPDAVLPSSETADLEDLIRSLDTPGDDEPGGRIASETDFGEEPAASPGVISTDAYLADFGGDIGLTGGLGDELTALTGGGTGRQRPAATVAKLPEPGQAPVLHRDQMVDKSLIEQIIKGIESL